MFNFIELSKYFTQCFHCITTITESFRLIIVWPIHKTYKCINSSDFRVAVVDIHTVVFRAHKIVNFTFAWNTGNCRQLIDGSLGGLARGLYECTNFLLSSIMHWSTSVQYNCDDRNYFFQTSPYHMLPFFY